MGKKFFKRVENTVGKGDIARYEQFLLFPQCFQKACTAETYKPGLIWESIKSNSGTICRPCRYGLLCSSVHSYPESTLSDKEILLSIEIRLK